MVIVINGVKTQYQRIGKGPQLLLLHGWGCDWQIWSPLIAQLSEHFQLILPDLPAFGQSDNPPSVWSSQEYLTWLTAFVDEVITDKKCVIGGHSFGGKLAALFAARKPSSKVPSKVILIDASGLPDPLSPRLKLQKQLLGFVPKSLKNLLPQRLKLKTLNALGSSTDHFYAKPLQKEIFLKVVVEKIDDELVTISQPTLILWGDQDQDTPLHQGQRFARLIPHAQLQVFEGAGHFPFVDQPANVYQTIMTFLKP